jgi:hypothetical protein
VGRGHRGGECGVLEGTCRVHGDSRQSRFDMWAPSRQRAVPIFLIALDALALHLVFSHLWTAMHPGRVHEE